jgi:hypothetical protein
MAKAKKVVTPANTAASVPATAQVKAPKGPSKVELAATIVSNAFGSYADDVAKAKASGATAEAIGEITSPRQRAIAAMAVSLFPNEKSATARNTYYQLGFARLMKNLSAEGQAALEKGKQVYSVFKLHTDKGVTKVSNVLLTTSQAKAKQLVAQYQMDGFEAGNLAIDTVKQAA